MLDSGLQLSLLIENGRRFLNIYKYYEYLPACMCLPLMCPIPVGVLGRHQIPGNWSYR